MPGPDVFKNSRLSLENALADSRNQAGRAGMLVGLAAGIGLALSALLAVTVLRRLAAQHALEHKAVEDARRVAASRQETLAIVSHDLRGPLGTILTGSDLLHVTLGDSPGMADAHRHVAAIQLAADRRKHLVDQILDAAQIDAGTLRLNTEPCDVGGLLHTSIDVFSAHAAQASVFLNAEPLISPAAVQADKERVLQILANLIGNGLKFTPAGGRIMLRACVMGNDVQFQIEDTGPGIHSDQLAHVFDRYWQAKPDNPKRGDGVGLGLYICKKLVEAHRGVSGLIHGSDEAHASSSPCRWPHTSLPILGLRCANLCCYLGKSGHEPTLLHRLPGSTGDDRDLVSGDLCRAPSTPVTSWA